MKTIKCIIVDDEPLAIEGIKLLTKKVAFLKLLSTFDNAFNANEYINQHEVDLVITDIQMPQLNGIEWIKTIKQKPLIIFTTAHLDYAIEGFNLNAIDYLLKPVSFDRFFKAVNKAHEYLELKHLQKKGELSPDNDFIFIRSEGKFEKIFLNDILYIEGLKDYVKIYTQTPARSYITAMNLRTISDKLPGGLFTRTHKSYLVNLSKIKSVDKASVFLQNKEVPIGDNYKEALYKLLIKGKLIKR
jgi:DNA-binding LytR/AlgR family response regulator